MAPRSDNRVRRSPRRDAARARPRTRPTRTLRCGRCPRCGGAVLCGRRAPPRRRGGRRRAALGRRRAARAACGPRLSCACGGAPPPGELKKLLVLELRSTQIADAARSSAARFFARARTHGLNIDKAIKKNINGREHTFDRGEYSATWCVRNRSHGLPASRFLISRWETSHTHSQSVSKTGQETGCFHFSKNKSVLSSLAHQGYAEPRAHRPSHSAQTVRVQQRTESGSGL